MPKDTDEEKAARKKAVQSATKYAIEIPFRVMEVSLKSMDLMLEMCKTGNPNSVTDAAVGGLCAKTAVLGAWLNVRVNTGGYDDKAYVDELLKRCDAIRDKAENIEKEILNITLSKI